MVYDWHYMHFCNLENGHVAVLFERGVPKKVPHQLATGYGSDFNSAIEDAKVQMNRLMLEPNSIRYWEHYEKASS